MVILGAVAIAAIAIYNLPALRRARKQRAAERAAEQLARERAAAEAQKQAEDAAQKLVDIYTSGSQTELPLLNDNVSGVILQGGENCCLFEFGVGHIVFRRRTEYVGGSQGVSFRIAKGVRYHVGAYRGHPVTYTDAVASDTGALYVTNKRVIFAGHKEITTVAVKKVSDVRVDGEQVIILCENRKTAFILRTPSKYGSVVAAAAIRRVTDDATGATVAPLPLTPVRNDKSLRQKLRRAESPGGADSVS